MTLTRHWKILLIVGLLSLGVILNVVGAWQNSQTSDEGNHLAGGVAYLQQHDFTWNPAHPPLVKLMAAAPLVIGQLVKIDTAWPIWTKPYLRGLIEKLFYDQPGLVQPQMLYFLARLPVILFWLLLGIILFRWSSARWGYGAGLLATTVFAFDPNFLGHGHLINTDVPVTALFFATFWAADRYFRTPRRNTLLLLALLFGLTQVTKFSSVILWPMLFSLGLIKIWLSRRQYSWRQWWIMVATVTGVTLAVIWTTYGFEVRRINSSRTSLRPIVRLFNTFPFPYPAASYWRGLYDVILHNEEGHISYFNGRQTTKGDWRYFPEVVALKTPILTLTLFGCWVMYGAIKLQQKYRRREFGSPSFDVWLFGLFPITVFMIAVTSNLNIGLRHIFPVYPFIFMAIGSLVTVPLSIIRRRGSVLIGAIMVVAGIVLWHAWPNTIGYMNAFAGGTQGGHRYVLDSNIDWGQDAWRLRQWFDQQKFPLIRVGLFTSIPTTKIFPESAHLIRNKNIAAGVQPTGVIAISQNILYRPGTELSWMRSYTPKWRIGSSILVYDFR